MGKMLNLNGRVFLFGGETSDGKASDEVFVFKQGNEGGAYWEPQRKMLHPRSYHTAIALPESFLSTPISTTASEPARKCEGGEIR